MHTVALENEDETGQVLPARIHLKRLETEGGNTAIQCQIVSRIYDEDKLY